MSLSCLLQCGILCIVVILFFSRHGVIQSESFSWCLFLRCVLNSNAQAKSTFHLCISKWLSTYKVKRPWRQIFIFCVAFGSVYRVGRLKTFCSRWLCKSSFATGRTHLQRRRFFVAEVVFISKAPLCLVFLFQTSNGKACAQFVFKKLAIQLIIEFICHALCSQVCREYFSSLLNVRMFLLVKFSFSYDHLWLYLALMFLSWRISLK